MAKSTRRQLSLRNQLRVRHEVAALGQRIEERQTHKEKQAL
jgi:hypothetical protein